MAHQFTLGIDLGTTNSVAAVWADKNPRRAWPPTTGVYVLKIQNVSPQELLRSVVFLESSDRVYAGEEAWNRRGLAPDRFVQSVKAEMGTDRIYSIGDKKYTPEEISTFILREIIERATSDLSQKVGEEVEFRNLVVTVPARFSPKAKKATERAVEMAGYRAGPWTEPRTHELLLESDAAVLAFLQNYPEKQIVLVYDLGGGTFDVSLMEYTGDPESAEPFRPIGPAGGDPRLGGDVFDQRIFARMVEHLNTVGGEDLPKQRRYPEYLDLDLTKPVPEGADPKAWRKGQQALLAKARLLKEVLCSGGMDADTPHEVYLPEVMGRLQPLPFKMTRSQFEALIADRIEATGIEVKRLLTECHVDAGDVDQVVLTGGSSRIPAIREMLRSIFGYAPNSTLEPDKAIAFGAALYAEVRKVIVPRLKLLTLPMGLKVTRRIEESIVGSIKKEREEKNRLEVIFKRGDVYPLESKRTVTTVRENQKEMRFEFYQDDSVKGEGACQVKDFIGYFDLEIPEEARGKRGVPKVEITFSLRENGTDVDISAVDKVTGRDVKLTVQLYQLGAKPPEEKGGGTGIADIVVIMDTTGSMAPYIRSMQRLTKEFAAKVSESGIDFQLALVDYRDVKIKERIEVHPFTKAVDEFQRHVDGMSAGGGGDEPESALDALESALELPFRRDAQRIFILITDASTHDPSERGASLATLGDRLRKEQVSVYVVSGAQHKKQYTPLFEKGTESNGRFYEMGRSFEDILSDIARQIRDIILA